MNTTRGGTPAALEAVYGKGRVIIIPGPIGDVFAATDAAAIRDFGRTLLAPYFRPLVEVDAPPTVEVVLRQKQGELLVHLVNTTAMQVAGEYATVDYIPAAGPIRLRVRGARPRAARLEPEGTPLMWRAVPGGWQAAITQLNLHAVAVMVKSEKPASRARSSVG